MGLMTSHMSKSNWMLLKNTSYRNYERGDQTQGAQEEWPRRGARGRMEGPRCRSISDAHGVCMLQDA